MELFGFSITKKAEKEENLSFAPPEQDDGASLVSSGWLSGSYVDLDGGAKNETDLINRYRDIAMYPDCDSAIEEIINECISVEDSDQVLQLNLDDTGLPTSIKKTIEEEFKNVLDLLEFRTKAHDIFKRWYIDGRIYYHKILDPNNPTNGIIELRYIDPRKIKRVKEVKKDKDPNTGVEFITVLEDFYLYNGASMNTARGATPSIGNSTQSSIKIAIDTIATVNSGLMDNEKNIVIGYLQTAVKPTNQLRMVEDAVVINALVRAPLRRIFNVYTGNLPPAKAQEHTRNQMNQFRNKLTFNASTGEVNDGKNVTNMLEDYWFPKGRDGASTTVDNIEGGQDIADNDKLNYYQKKLYQALKVPFSRMQSDGVINFGRQSEISKEELKFAKYINRLRRKFSELFEDILCTQLIAKGILKYEDWEAIRSKIRYIYNSDIYWQDSKNNEIMREKVELLTLLDPFVGKYFSKEYVERTVLKLSEEEKEQMDAELEQDYALQQQREQEELIAQSQIENASKQGKI